MTRPSRTTSDAGSGSVYVLVAAGAVLALGLAAAAVGDAVVQRHRADSMADLAALAGAGALVRGEDGCAAAGAYVGADGARVVTCRVEPGPAILVRIQLPAGPVLSRVGLATVTAQARAGPASPG